MTIGFTQKVSGWLGTIPPILLLIATIAIFFGGWQLSGTREETIVHSASISAEGRGFQARIQTRLEELEATLEGEVAATDSAMLGYGLEESLLRSRQMLAERLVGLRSLTILREDDQGDFKVVVDVRSVDGTGPPPTVSHPDSESRHLAVTHGMTTATTVIAGSGNGWLDGESEFICRWRQWETPNSRQKLFSVYVFDRATMERRLDDFMNSWLTKESQSMKRDEVGFEIRNARSGNILVVWKPNSARVADSKLQASSPLAAWELSVWMPTKTVTQRSPVVLALTLLLGGLMLASTVLSFAHRLRNRRSEENRVTFLTRISHDLRTPITNLRLSVDMAEDDLKDEDISEAQSRLKKMRSDLRQLGGLLDNALDYSRGVRSPGLTEASPQEVIREVIDSFRPSYELRGIALKVDGIESLPPRARLHSDILTRIMGNLMDNARKYASEGQWVGIKVSPKKEAIQILISDRGPGLEPGALQNLNGESSLTDPFGGGLGLRISKELAEITGGMIEVVKADIGVTFKITLPMYPPEAQ